MMTVKISAFVLAFFCWGVVLAQSDSLRSPENKKLLTTTKNREYTGFVISDDGRELLFESDNVGKIYFEKDQIRSIKPFEAPIHGLTGDYVPHGPFTTRYAFTTNAMPIARGENYVKFGIIGPEVHFAVSDNFSLGMMGTWIMSPLGIAAKYSFKKPEAKNPNVNFSLGTVMGSSGYFLNFRGYGGLHWANVTFGNPANNLTLSAGYAYVHWGQTEQDLTQGPEMTDKLPGHKMWANGPAFSLAGIFSVGSKASIVFDSMIFAVEADKTETINYNYIGTDGMYYFSYKEGYTGRRKFTLAVLMPGMRFQTSDRNAFQLTFGGVSILSDEPDFGGSAPVPMYTWFYRL